MIIPTQFELENLQRLQAKVFKGVEEFIKIHDGGTKRYEGTFSIIFPGYFENDENKIILKLDLYIFGPTRHYYWPALTLTEAIAEAEADIDQWLKEDRELFASDDIDVDISKIIYLYDGKVLFEKQTSSEDPKMIGETFVHDSKRYIIEKIAVVDENKHVYLIG